MNECQHDLIQVAKMVLQWGETVSKPTAFERRMILDAEASIAKAESKSQEVK